MADWRMIHLMDKVTSDSAAKERKPATVPKLPHHQPHQPPKESHAENHPEQNQTPSRNIIAEEHAGFRAGRSTTEQNFNLRDLCEKYLQHQQDLYHVFIDFKKAFDRVWLAAMWATIRKYNISANLI